MYLHLVNVTKVFPGRGGVGEVTAVDDVSLDIAEGRTGDPAGPIRLRQNDDLAHDRRLRVPDQR